MVEAGWPTGYIAGCFDRTSGGSAMRFEVLKQLDFQLWPSRSQDSFVVEVVVETQSHQGEGCGLRMDARLHRGRSCRSL